MPARSSKEENTKVDASKKKLTDLEKDPKTTSIPPADASLEAPVNASALDAMQCAYRVEIKQLKDELEAHIKALEKKVDRNKNEHDRGTRPYHPDFPLGSGMAWAL